MTAPLSPVPPIQGNPQTQRLVRFSPIIAGVDLIMRALQSIQPRLYFQALDHGGQDSPAFEVREDPLGWVRGVSTSPGGAPLAAQSVVDSSDPLFRGNYFIGAPESFLQGPPPQRIVWEPPGEDEEVWGPPDAVGPRVDLQPWPEEAPPDTPWPISPAEMREYAQMGGGVVPQNMSTWLIPMRAHIWGMDYDDTWTLAHNLQAATYTVFNGCTAVNGAPICPSGGWPKDQRATAGLHYVQRVNLCTSIVLYWGQRSVQVPVSDTRIG